MRRFAFVFVVVLVIAQTAMAADPGAAIGQARQALNEKRFDQAIQLLQGAIPDAAALVEPQHSQALAAIHFFSALAFNGLKDETKTREELQQFFTFNPNAKALDASRYDAGFIKLFTQVQKEPRISVETTGNFDAVYPGYVPLLDHDKDLARRTAFADEVFHTAKSRGSLTDRGRIFVLLGPPRVIKQQPLTAKDGAFNRVGGAAATRNINTAGPSNLSGNMRETMVNDLNQETVLPEPNLGGSVERWIYSREQLPESLRDKEVAIKFITQQGYGDHVLQREMMVNKLLADAAAPH
jgi:hypothetical protein